MPLLLGDRAIFAVDFDGTIVEAEYPRIGRLRPGAVEFLRRAREDGHVLILNTCRTDEKLKEALDFLEAHGVRFDYVNDNCAELAQLFGNSRKISADYYLDDHNVGWWSWSEAIGLLEALRRLKARAV